MSFVIGVLGLAVMTALACTLPGTFLVLRRQAMLVDAISHAILPGIVAGYFFTHDLSSPLLIVGAAAAGLAVVSGSEVLRRSGLITGDAPQGLVFPALFSLGIILISAEFTDIHLDTHTVLVGDLNLAAFDQLTIAGVSLGPQYLYVMAGLALINAAFLAVCYRPLTTQSFDDEFARSAGLRGGIVSALFMLLTAITVTAAFYAAGAVLTLALIIVPPATALLISRRVPRFIVWSLAVAVGGAAGGFAVSYLFDAPTSAGMAVFYAALFAVVFIVRELINRPKRAPRAQRAETHTDSPAI